jgi:hypothetical protein
VFDNLDIPLEHHLRIGLALGHVRLIEWVDAENGPGHRRRKLPPEELGPEIFRSAKGQTHERMATVGESLELLHLAGLLACVGKGNKYSIALV